jgi:hypothetical protein
VRDAGQSKGADGKNQCNGKPYSGSFDSDTLAHLLKYFVWLITSMQMCPGSAGFGILANFSKWYA